MTLALAPSFSNCVRKVLRRETDAVFTDTVLLYGYAAQNDELQVLPDINIGDPTYYGIGLPKGHLAECERIRKALVKYARTQWTTDFKNNLPAAVAADSAYINHYRPDNDKMNEDSCRSD
ncbi:hypothetical protein ASE41_29755 [Streptomyces sp. Root264]|nr:hypothetical protein ASE41_29755 [Streptomyces sp. Root264]